MRRGPALALGLLAACASLPAAAPLEARWPIGGDVLVLGSLPRFAGAVSSLRFRGVEHLDASDHGRLLQSAISFDGAGECLNPTQAGASSDGRRSTSRLLSAQAGPDAWVTVTRMAFWLRPGQTCTGRNGRPAPALNTRRLSDVLLRHRITPDGRPGALRHEITFTTAEPRQAAVVEALTLYAPASFSAVHVFRDGRLVPDPVAAPGEQDHPVVLSTPDGRHAVGFAAGRGDVPARYGRFRFGPTPKINVVFRPAGPYAPGAHTYEVLTLVGARAEVERALRDLPN